MFGCLSPLLTFTPFPPPLPLTPLSPPHLRLNLPSRFAPRPAPPTPTTLSLSSCAGVLQNAPSRLLEMCMQPSYTSNGKWTDACLQVLALNLVCTANPVPVSFF